MADSITAGFYKDSKDGSDTFSRAWYYKEMEKIGYRNSAEILAHDFVEGHLQFGKVR